MDLSESKKNEWESNLKEIELMSADETIEEHTKGDFWELLSQTRGQYFFTNEKFIFVGGILGVDNFAIPYSSIKSLKLCNVGGIIPIVPTGIKVTYMNEKGKLRTKKCSVPKRKEWLAYLSEKSHVTAG